MVTLDALNRAVRTWWQAVGGGVLVAVGDLGLKLLQTGDVYTGDFWNSLIKGIIGAVLTATFAYAARFKVPPKPAPETTTLPANEAARVEPENPGGA